MDKKAIQGLLVVNSGDEEQRVRANIIEALCKLGIDYPELSCGIMAQAKDAG